MRPLNLAVLGVKVIRVKGGSVRTETGPSYSELQQYLLSPTSTGDLMLFRRPIESPSKMERPVQDPS